MLSFAGMSDPTPLRPAYIICGTDRPKVQRAVAQLRRRVETESGSDLNIEVFDAESTTPEAVVESASTPGFSFGTRLLVLLNGHKWKVKQRQTLVAYLKDPMPDTCLAIEGETFAKDDALSKAVTKVGDILRYDLPKRWELAGWVTGRARSCGLRLSAPVAKHLLSVSGEAPERLEREIEKLATYCRGAEATTKDVDAVCSPSLEVKIFDLMDAVGVRDRRRAFTLLESVYAGGEDANAVLYNLKRHVRLLDEVSQLDHDDAASAAKQLKVHAFRAKKLLEQRRHYDRRRFAEAYGALAEAEVRMRGRAPASLESSGGVNHGDRFMMELALGRMLA
jgi:DNA polymerase III delta subunit